MKSRLRNKKYIYDAKIQEEKEIHNTTFFF